MKDKDKGYLALGAVGFYLFFNRNPDRIIEDGKIISPTDGTIEKIENGRIDIQIGIFDVHVQRAPISGTVRVFDYPDENKNVITIDDMTIERRGGVLARSVITYVKTGDIVTKGQEIGKIILGSHAAIWPVLNPVVRVGDHVIAGQRIE